MREQVKRLTRLFYSDNQAESGTARKPLSANKPPTGVRVSHLPLWRTEWSVLPVMQEFLHVVAPHYLHMFEAIFSRGRPWMFGHVYLPGGSKNLGQASYQLSSGSRAPLVGVLMQVTRAVRLRDGKLLVLATAVTRLKVVRCVQEVPYSVCDVELYEDCELQESFNNPALAAVMQAAADDTSIPCLMAAGSAAARDACAAVSWAWLRGYELAVAAQQEWIGPGPMEGESDMETHWLVQDLMANGVSEVLPLPDGNVIGRRDLQDVTAAADAAFAQAMQAATQLVQPGAQAPPAAGSAAAAEEAGCSASLVPNPLASYEESRIVSLNTTVERGISLHGPEFAELTSSSSASSSCEDVLMLEAAVWAQLDTLVALASRVKGNRHVLPFGLLQLRPAPVQPQMAHPAARWAANPTGNSSSSGSSAGGGVQGVAGSYQGSWSEELQPPAVAEVVSDEDDDSSNNTSMPESSSSSNGPQSSTAASSPSSSSPSSGPEHQQQQQQHWLAASRYAFAASDGMDVHADPLWPPLRRAAKLSWAAAVVVGQMEQKEKGEVRQALLEAPSIAQRLRFVSAVLGKHIKVLAAVAAVKGVQEQ